MLWNETEPSIAAVVTLMTHDWIMGFSFFFNNFSIFPINSSWDSFCDFAGHTKLLLLWGTVLLQKPLSRPLSGIPWFYISISSYALSCLWLQSHYVEVLNHFCYTGPINIFLKCFPAAAFSLFNCTPWLVRRAYWLWADGKQFSKDSIIWRSGSSPVWRSRLQQGHLLHKTIKYLLWMTAKLYFYQEKANIATILFKNMNKIFAVLI